jgi:lipopolysaccharide transport system permease protein/teichoic acid transport system permease protein
MASTAAGLPERFRQLWARRETIRFLTSSSLKSGHRDKVLGHLWNLLDPLMFMLVYYFVFGVLFKLAGGGRSSEFMLYILVGILAFRFISSTISQAAGCIRTHRGLIHEINFPKAVFPVSVALSRLYDFLWGLVVMFGFLMIVGNWPTVQILWLPVLVVLMVVFTLGVALVVAYLGAFFADTTNVVAVAMRLLFYCSPVFYFVRDEVGYKVDGGLCVEFVKYRALFHSDLARLVYMWNPIACLFECFRDVLLWGRAPDLHLLHQVAVVSIIICVVGFAVFTRSEGRFAKYI